MLSQGPRAFCEQPGYANSFDLAERGARILYHEGISLVSIRSPSPRDLRVRASLDEHRTELGMTGPHQILSSHGQLKLLSKVPTQPGVRRVIRVYSERRQGAHVPVGRIKLKPFGQMEQNLGSRLIMRARSLIRRHLTGFCVG